MVIRGASDSVELTLRQTGPRGTPAEGDLCLRIGVITSALVAEFNSLAPAG